MKIPGMTTILLFVVAAFYVLVFAALVLLFVLAVKALWKYLHTPKEVRQEKTAVCKSLGEALKVQRTKCNMTQEFVANSLGVSRQAVSKWESGASDPTTSNLLALAKLYGVSAEELLRTVEK